ncbi:MAG: sulfite exporter TauE/SafE family protein [Alphaproteobacteria bacterium]
MDDFLHLGPLFDGRLAIVATAVLVAGVVRGFSGFGTAMVLMPIASAAYSPTTALVLLFVTDTVMTVPLVARAAPLCRWRQVLPMVAGAAVTAPLGVYLLTELDPVLVRWMMSLLIFAVVAVLIAGWRYRRAATPPLAFGVGGASGFSAGLTGLSGPPVVLFWLGGQDAQPRQVRADLIVYFGLMSVISAYSYWLNDVFTWVAVQIAVLLLLPYGLGLWLGARGFGRSREAHYRWLAYGLCAGAAALALPVWA